MCLRRLVPLQCKHVLSIHPHPGPLPQGEGVELESGFASGQRCKVLFHRCEYQLRRKPSSGTTAADANKWAHLGSNQGPSPYEGAALTAELWALATLCVQTRDSLALYEAVPSSVNWGGALHSIAKSGQASRNAPRDSSVVPCWQCAGTGVSTVCALLLPYQAHQTAENKERPLDGSLSNRRERAATAADG